MRIDPCPDCGEHVNINSDHAPECPRRQGVAAMNNDITISDDRPENPKELPEGKDAIDFDLTLTLPNGVIVPAEYSIVYPEGMGFHAVKGLQKLMDEGINVLFQQLLNKHDASLIAVMMEQQNDDEDEG